MDPYEDKKENNAQDIELSSIENALSEQVDQIMDGDDWMVFDEKMDKNDFSHENSDQEDDDDLHFVDENREVGESLYFTDGKHEEESTDDEGDDDLRFVDENREAGESLRFEETSDLDKTVLITAGAGTDIAVEEDQKTEEAPVPEKNSEVAISAGETIPDTVTPAEDPLPDAVTPAEDPLPDMFIPKADTELMEDMSEKEQAKYLKKKEKEAAAYIKAREKEEARQNKRLQRENIKEQKRAKKEAAREARGGKPSPVPFIVIGSIILLLAIVYFGGVYYFSGHFGANSMVNGEDVSFQSIEQVEDMISTQVQGYSLTILERKDASEVVQGTEVGLEYVPDGQVKQLIKDQKPFIWPYRFFAKEKLQGVGTHASVKLDEKLFEQKASTLKCLDEAQMIPPADAFPEQDGALFVVHPEEIGTTLVDRNKTKELIKETMLQTIAELDLEAEGQYTNPAITSESPEVTEVVDRYNEYCSLSITYHFGEEVDVLDGSTTFGWITWDENNNAVINQDAIVEWTREFGKRHDRIGVTRTFTNPRGETYSVSGGTYGWSVDEAAEIDMINQMFAEKQSQDREPIWATTAAAWGEQDFGNTYIEVNLSTQHTMFWQEGNCIFECDVVTGLPNGKRNTPEGTWSILEMKQNKVLRGERRPDGSYEYETPVAYWMRVTWTGVGFHDATWQSSFGGNRYTYAGSHGCINMPYSGAQEMYGICYVGCPVIIHY